jgi:hypothetical protein
LTKIVSVISANSLLYSGIYSVPTTSDGKRNNHSATEMEISIIGLLMDLYAENLKQPITLIHDF